MAPESDDMDPPWLRDQVDDEEILELFTDNPEQLKHAIRSLIVRSREDLTTESLLIDILETAVDEGTDDSEASAWIAIILGEACSRSALGLLIRCLGNDSDELLQDTAGVALLRVGSPAVILVMDTVEEELGQQFNRAAYRFLGETGVLEDEILNNRVLQFLDERLDREYRASPGESALEELATACGRLGHRKLMAPLKKLLARRYRGYNTALEDAISMLEENEAGVPFVPTIPPWEERYGWLFENDLEWARVQRLEDADRGQSDLYPS